MADPERAGEDAPAEDEGERDPPEVEEGPDDAGPTGDGPDTGASGDETGADGEALREQVRAEYDFESFGPADMAEMSADEWEAAFDPDAWVTGERLLDRVEADLRARVAERDVFAVVERADGGEPRVVAYADDSFAIVHPDGTVEGEGTVLQDVKPTVALASMPDYDVPEPPEDGGLPDPTAVEGTGSDLGDRSLQVVAGMLVLSAVVLFGGALVADIGNAAVVAFAVGFVFLAVGVGLLFTVANARLSARYRAEEFRDRLRAVGVDSDDRPEFLPVDDAAFVGSGDAADGSDNGNGSDNGDGRDDGAPRIDG